MALKPTSKLSALLNLTDREPEQLWTETENAIMEECEKIMPKIKRKKKNQYGWTEETLKHVKDRQEVKVKSDKKIGLES